MSELVFDNCRIVLEYEIVDGHVVVRDGKIAEIANGPAPQGVAVYDCEGGYLVPGLVELHTDNLEKHLLPRPKVLWPEPESAFFAHDAQIVSSGITTVFDALSVGEYHDKGRIAMLGEAVQALHSCRETGALRADHLLHLRCEVADPRMQDLFFPLTDEPALHLVSLMDHTPGQRQWRNTESYRTYYSQIVSWTDEEFSRMVDELQAKRDACADGNAASVVAFCHQRKLPMASHDDTLLEHVNEALANGVSICEFPTTEEAARYAAESGMTVLMGAPNIVRGGSHSGNVGAEEVAKQGYLGALSSDYVPISLIGAVFTLAKHGTMTLPEAMQLVTSRPADAVGLKDRGRIAEGLRADLAVLRLVDDVPLVRSVWREGRQVF